MLAGDVPAVPAWGLGRHVRNVLRAFGGTVASPLFGDLLYFSFTTLTSTGFGDAVPLRRFVRGLCVLEQLVGALFLAILIARLAGVYPPGRPDAGS